MKPELEEQLMKLKAVGKQIAVTHELPGTRDWLVTELKGSEVQILPFTDLSELEAKGNVGAVVLGFSDLRPQLKQLADIEPLSRRLKSPFVVVSTSSIVPGKIELELLKREKEGGVFLPREIVAGLDPDLILEAIARGLWDLEHELDGASAYRRFRITSSNS